jgi:primase-polymerase (primpol)-like protein
MYSPLTVLEEGRFHVPKEIDPAEVWIGFRIEEDDDGKLKKVPKAPFMSSKQTLYDTNPTSRRDAVTFAEAIEFVHESKERLGEDGADGVGLVLSDDDDIAGVDLDGCRDAKTGEVEDWAFDIVRQLDSYTEVSPSGTGLHVLVKGELDDEFQQKNDELGLEMYDSDRFLTFTGRWIPSTRSEIKDRHDEFLNVQRANLPVSDDVEIDMEGDSLPDLPTGRDVDLKPEDEEIVEDAKETDPDFEPLWRGSTALNGGDHSRADFYLACKLAYRCYSDIEQMDRIFRQSGLMRDKWDAPRGNITYGQYTLQKAVEKNGRTR